MKLVERGLGRLLLRALVLAGACAPGAVENPDAELVERARAIHDRVVTLDTHVDINAANFTAARNYTTDLPIQITLPKMEEGGLDAAFLIVYVGQGPLTEAGYADAHASAIEKFEAIHRLTEEIAPDRIGLALNSDDVRRIASEGRKVALIGIENAYQVGADLANIEDFHGFELLDSGDVFALPAGERANYQARMEEVRALAEPRMEAEVHAVAPPVDVADFVDHIDYMVGLIGIEHAGISSDFDGGGGVHGWEDASETFNVTLELVRRGYTEDEIDMLWSGNLLRVLDDVQRVARESQTDG